MGYPQSRCPQGVSGQVRGCVGQGRVPGQEPGHHWQRGALVPLGPALNWLQQQPTAGLAGPGSSFWLIRLAEPVLVIRILQCVLTEPGNY